MPPKMLHPKRRALETGTRLIFPLTQKHRYCQYAFTDGGGDWYDPRPVKSEAGGNAARRHFEKASEAGMVNALTFCRGPGGENPDAAWRTREAQKLTKLVLANRSSQPKSEDPTPTHNMFATGKFAKPLAGGRVAAMSVTGDGDGGRVCTREFVLVDAALDELWRREPELAVCVASTAAQALAGTVDAYDTVQIERARQSYHANRAFQEAKRLKEQLRVDEKHLTLYADVAEEAGFTAEMAAAIEWTQTDARKRPTLPISNPEALYPAHESFPLLDVADTLHKGSQHSAPRSVDQFIVDLRKELKKEGNKGHKAVVLAGMPLLNRPEPEFQAVVSKLADAGQWDHIFANASAAASTSNLRLPRRSVACVKFSERRVVAANFSHAGALAPIPSTSTSTRRTRATATTTTCSGRRRRTARRSWAWPPRGSARRSAPSATA